MHVLDQVYFYFAYSWFETGLQSLTEGEPHFRLAEDAKLFVQNGKISSRFGETNPILSENAVHRRDLVVIEMARK